MEKENTKLNASEVLARIQSEVKAPKNLTNAYAGYKYRNVESIYESVKPLLKEYGASLILNDSVELVGDRFYIKATATLTYKGESISAQAYARETLERKGLDSAQITGSASSYARKYALSGLLLLDDNQDLDAQNHADEAKQKQAQSNQSAPKVTSAPQSKKQKLASILASYGMSAEDMRAFVEFSVGANADEAKIETLLIDSKLQEKARAFMQARAQR